MDDDDATQLVRLGYDAVSERYRPDDEQPAHYEPWIAGLAARLPAGANVLDVGCGCGVPLARELARAGHWVTGVDLSDVQIRRAKRLVPTGRFLRMDMTAMQWPPRSFDAVVALYSVIHVPVAAQPELIGHFADWLVDGGTLLLVAGATAWTGTAEGWLGSAATMWWSHADAVTYRAWINAAGLQIVDEQFVPEGEGGHSLFWAQRPSSRGSGAWPG